MKLHYRIFGCGVLLGWILNYGGLLGFLIGIIVGYVWAQKSTKFFPTEIEPEYNSIEHYYNNLKSLFVSNK